MSQNDLVLSHSAMLRKIVPAKRPQVKREESHILEVEEDFDLGKELEWLNEVIDEEEEYEEEEEEHEEEEEDDKDGGEWMPTGGKRRRERRGKGGESLWGLVGILCIWL